jgi:hypothetical protein
MSATVVIRIPPETQAKLERLQALPEEVPQAIKRGMDYALSEVRGRIQVERLGGKGPYPPEEHRLGIVTQQLQRSLREEPAVITDGGETITGSIGSPLFYGALHEYGWSGTVVRGGHSLGFSGVIGRALRRLTGGGAPYHMTIPERAAVRTGVQENAGFIAEEIGAEIDASLEATER